ncbi:MAG: nuclear transport factor 2 family protein [Pseudolabrys sp.]|nr:nuclear transport factor 2 family protein [Pseudolabrys sp.]
MSGFARPLPAVKAPCHTDGSQGEADMSDRMEMESLVRALYAARVGNDIATVERLFADDAQFEILGSNPAAVKTIGKRNIVAAAQALMKTFVMDELEIVALLIDGNRAAVHWRVQVKPAGSGTSAPTDMIDILTIENGRVTALTEICDSALAMRLAGSAPRLQMA